MELVSDDDRDKRGSEEIIVMKREAGREAYVIKLSRERVVEGK